MSGGALKMVAHLGEAGRIDGRAAVDVVMDEVARAGVLAAAVLRGVEGFGAHHRLMTDRLLSLSEDLPIVVVAVGPGEVVAPLAARVGAVLPGGIVTLEGITVAGTAERPDGAEAKLVVYCGRGEPNGGRPTPERVSDALREAGLTGAIVLNAVDGVLHGTRRRARLGRRNREVPAMVIAVGAAARVAAALARVRDLAGPHVATLERVSVLRRDGVTLGAPPTGGGDLWQRLTVTAGEDDADDGRPLYVVLVRALREAGGPGATALRGVRGHTGADARHGDRLLALRRRTPVLVTAIARPADIARLWPVVERATRRTGLVTWERVPRIGGPPGSMF